MFTITVSWPQTLDDMLPLEAYGGSFIFGPGINSASSYCPTSVGTGCPVGNQTVFTADGGALDVEVPGGQQVYVAPNGALSFTQAHSISYPPGSQFGGFGGNGGEFVYAGANGTAGWITCPVDALDFSPPLNYIYQIYANVSSHPTRYPNNGPFFVCYDVTLLLDKYTGGFGAWQYA
ncbi:hypothetical protein MMC17_002214 [Xylographa soralifera]|nr:hypothetical protein [Xylographa soralifera]